MSRHMPRSGWVWLGIGAAYFFIPLAATLEFSLKEVSGYGFSAYREILSDPQFRDLLWVSFKLSLATIVVSLLILIPGVYSVHLSFPRLRPLVEFLSVLPFVVPPIILIVGLLDFYNLNHAIYDTYVRCPTCKGMYPSIYNCSRIDRLSVYKIIVFLCTPSAQFAFLV